MRHAPRSPGGFCLALIFFRMKPTDPDPKAPKQAAAYVRMSTEHQQYSTLNQIDLIREYADLHGLEIVKIYSDDGKSGLNIKGRAALAQMIADVTNGDAGYRHILVYDVTRWGRFQDADESAHYEYLCRRAGVAVHFCAEDFKSDGSMSSTLYKGIKRVFAGDYSRVLSEKVFRGACRLIGLGFRQGGAAGFGLRRMLLDHAGNSKGLLKIGEKKSIQTDRVVLVLGPDEEVETVRWMYQSFVGGGKREAEIAADLNERGVLTDFGRKWTRGTVHEVLTNEKYIGNNIYHRTSFKLKHVHVKNPRDKWVRADRVFTALVDPNVFDVAQRMILFRSRKFSNDEMLEKLRGVLTKHGRITGLLIDEEDDAPSSSAFRQRFGSLVRAYQLIGYTPEIDFSFIETNRVLRERHSTVVGEVVAKLREVGAVVVQNEDTGLLTLDDEWDVSLVIARHRATGAGFSRWLVRFDAGLKPDITVAVRMAPGNKEIKDYYLLPALDVEESRVRFAEHNGIWLDAYRFDTLDFFYGMARRCRVEDAA